MDDTEGSFIGVKGLTFMEIAIKLITSFPLGVFNQESYQKNLRDLIDYLSDFPSYHIKDSRDAAIRSFPNQDCVVCLEKPCNTVFIKCKHQCVCTDCINELEGCPICREKSHDKIVIVES